ncbi:class I SAM-dependent methyltransferase [Bdellovibrio sp. HCB337]|uniref:class I SAM-dependent methyltransferase n=1 Tax=Bdellovibrio sp. HCB337 TaxID=3394358 RepID=UPI0039A50AD8
MSKPTPDFFNKEAAQKYDERNSKLSRISDCLHFLMGLALKDLPARSRVLCVGVGTGAEILSLAQAYPEWTFVALEPSLDMLNVCRERMKNAGLEDRCEFVHGYVQDLPRTQPFDAALSVLVAHFIKRDERLSFFQHMSSHLRTGGYLVNSEISFDLNSAEFPMMLKGWEQVQTMMGATPESLALLPTVLRETLTVLPPSETEALLRQSGISLPLRFFQAMMICGWYGKKE